MGRYDKSENVILILSFKGVHINNIYKIPHKLELELLEVLK